MIRQAISCDICGSEKRQTNHWFVAHDQSGELRVTGWNSRNRLRPGSKHLCGQTCLHKLVDEYLARMIAVRPHAASSDEVFAQPQIVATDVALTSNNAFVEIEPSFAPMLPAMPMIPKPAMPIIARKLLQRPAAELVSMPARQAADGMSTPEQMPRFASRNLRAEAWDRERERELRAVQRPAAISSRRRSGS